MRIGKVLFACVLMLTFILKLVSVYYNLDFQLDGLAWGFFMIITLKILADGINGK